MDFEKLTLPNEEWKEIEGTEQSYFVSSLGRVLSLRGKEPRILKPFVCGNGYYYITIRYVSENGEVQWKDRRINQLVGRAFIPNPENKKIVHHKNEDDKLNNSVSNLEWATHSENAKYHIEYQKRKRGERDDERTA